MSVKAIGLSAIVVASIFIATQARSQSCVLVSVQTAGSERVGPQITAEIARTKDEMSKGLSNREALPRDAGMIFVFDPPRETGFWMKDTLIPLDILFFTDDGVLHKIHENAIPFDLTDIPSNGIISYVLEVNAGVAKDFSPVVGESRIAFDPCPIEEP